jgi:phosphate transport system substrate-binding protein
VLRKHSVVPFGDAADLMGKQEARVAFVDARLHANVLVLGDRPVAAPNATAASLTASAPASAETQKAKAQAARIAAEKEKEKKKNAPAGPSDANTGH